MSAQVIPEVGVNTREIAPDRTFPGQTSGAVPHPRIFTAEAFLVTLCVCFVLMGLLLIYCSSSVYSSQHYGNQYYFLFRQLGFAFSGFLLLAFFACRDYQDLRDKAGLLLILSLVLMLILWIPGLGKTVKGARRWLQLGPVNFQPSELVKLSLVVFLSYFLSRRWGKRTTGGFADYCRIWILCLPFLGLVLATRDFGTTVILGLAVMMLLCLAGAKPAHLLYTIAAGIPVGIYFCMQPFRLQRILSFRDPWKDAYGSGYQLVQSLLALGRGGWLGVGPGNGSEKLFYLPDGHTDFIFAVLGEEFGLAGCCVLLALFLLFVVTGVRVALRAPDQFGMLLASGITFLVGFQVILNVSVVMGLLPTKGMVLPFLSYGGSALWVNLMAVGILVSVARQGVYRSGPRG